MDRLAPLPLPTPLLTFSGLDGGVELNETNDVLLSCSNFLKLPSGAALVFWGSLLNY